MIGNNLREIELLQKLGYPIDNLSPYRDSDLLYAIIVHVAEAELNRLAPTDAILIPNREKINDRLKVIALRERLNTIGIEGASKVGKFQAILDCDKQANEKAIEKAKEIKLDFSEINLDESNNPKTIASLKETFEYFKSYFIDQRILGFISTDNVKTHFRNDSFSVQKYSDNLARNIDRWIGLGIKDAKSLTRLDSSSSLYPYINFYDKWSQYLKKEVFQGLGDSNQILGEGVCYAFNLRIEIQSRTQPNAGPNELSNVKINLQDRNKQARYQVGHKIENKSYAMGDIIHNQFTYEEKDFAKKVADLIPLLEPTKGWFNITIGNSQAAHAISFRIDEINNKIWLLDSTSASLNSIPQIETNSISIS